MKAQQNEVYIKGRIAAEITSYTSATGETFYGTNLYVPRQDCTISHIPVIFSNKIDVLKLTTTDDIRFYGYITNEKFVKEDGKESAELYVMVTEITTTSEFGISSNCVWLEGQVFKEPINTKDYKGRKVAEIMIANRTSNNDFYYIPCIIWGTRVLDALKLKTGTTITLTGKFQSRKSNTQENGKEVEVHKISADNFDVMDS